MPRYKRTFDEAELESALEPPQSTATTELLNKLRNLWEFASLMQYIHFFGDVVKIDSNFDIEDLEEACLAPQPSEKLAHIGLQFLKFVSSHRGLTPEIFDEYTRRQYVAKAPERNPYGVDEEPAKFDDFDVITKVRVLHQLSTWTLGNAERIRGMMAQDEDQTLWRIEALGWDREDRTYYVLDDNRLYRRTDEPIPPPIPKVKAKAKAKKPAKPKPAPKSRPRGTRTSKRLKLEEDVEGEEEDVPPENETGGDDTVMTDWDDAKPADEEPGFGFTSKTWECVAITLEEYQDFMASIFRTRDPNEKELHKRIEAEILPLISKRAEQAKAKQLKRLREIENLHKLASAKRSGRLADKAVREKVEQEEREAEAKRQRELKMAHEEQERQRKIEEGHESRRLTREQRLKEREVKRILHEEELARLEEAANRASSQDPSSEAMTESSKRLSERQLKTQKEKHQAELEKMAEEEEDWVFDCAVCGVHGENLDDGTHSIACERCNVWQHSKCHGISPKQAEEDDFHFVCGTCKRKEEEAKKPKIPPLKLAKNKSPEVQIPVKSQPKNTDRTKPAPLPDHIARQLDNIHYYQPQFPPPTGQNTNGSMWPRGGQMQGFVHQQYPPVGNFAPAARPPSQQWQGSPPPTYGRPTSSGHPGSPPPPMMANGYGSPAQHQQQHQYMHQNALAAAGGHPGHRAPYGQPYNYAPMPSPGMHPASAASSQSPPLQPAYHGPPPSNMKPNHQPHYRPSQSPQNHPAQMANGVQSPTKAVAKPAGSPTQSEINRHPPMMGPSGPRYAQHPPPPTHPAFTTPYGSSAPAHSTSPPQYPQQPQFQPPALTQTPLNPRPFLPSGVPGRQDQRPREGHPSPAGSNANGVAADGMSGPWPANSNAIPQKNLSPAPPQQAMSSPVERGSVLPPVYLMPSPGQNQPAFSGPQSVPVKKMTVEQAPATAEVPSLVAPVDGITKNAVTADAAGETKPVEAPAPQTNQESGQ